MFFKKITLTDYKNYTSRSFDFTERLVGICGLNGKGKTNLLDAINYLCFTKSYFSKSDAISTNFEREGFRLEGELRRVAKADLEKIVCIYRGPQRKEFYLDDVAYEKFSQHIGKFPCVVIAPDDIAMITGSSEERRKFLDTLISQLDAAYLQQLITYNKLLAQRNSFLKTEAQKGSFDFALLETFDLQLLEPAGYIHRVRMDFCRRLFPLVQQFYNRISGNKDVIGLEYSSALNENRLEELLLAARQKDRLTQRTNVGVHKDDLVFLLHENVFKTVASQGQRKSLLFACKLAEFEMIKLEKQFAPLLLLDDVFEKLDESRIENLLEFVCRDNTGQVFITDTHAQRLRQALSRFGSGVQIIELL